MFFVRWEYFLIVLILNSNTWNHLNACQQVSKNKHFTNVTNKLIPYKSQTYIWWSLQSRTIKETQQKTAEYSKAMHAIRDDSEENQETRSHFICAFSSVTLAQPCCRLQNHIDWWNLLTQKILFWCGCKFLSTVNWHDSTKHHMMFCNNPNRSSTEYSSYLMDHFTVVLNSQIYFWWMF